MATEETKLKCAMEFNFFFFFICRSIAQFVSAGLKQVLPVNRVSRHSESQPVQCAVSKEAFPTSPDSSSHVRCQLCMRPVDEFECSKDCQI